VVDGLGKLGEFGIIERIGKRAVCRRSEIVTGIGDDCAVLDAGEDMRFLVTTDMLVEGTHFLRGKITAQQLGYKSLAVNLSDIAAMGGVPFAAFLALGLTADLDEIFLDGFVDGLLECAGQHDVDLAGGDTVAPPGEVVTCLTVIGKAPASAILTRAGARPGDRIMLGGPVGDSRAGLHLVLGESAGDLAADERRRLLDAHLQPRPQVALGRLLSERHMASAAIDVSDGVAQDLSHICKASGTGAELDCGELPLSDAARKLAAAAGEDAVDWGLGGGEDFVLLFTVEDGSEREVIDACRSELGIEVRAVGQITERLGIRIKRDEHWTEGRIDGYDHFR